MPLIPRPPDWRIDWAALESALPEASELAACQQGPQYHGEGDVWTHTRLACEALTTHPSFRERSSADRALLFTAVLLHDVGKPACTRIEPDGRISSRGHARRMPRARLPDGALPIRVGSRTISLLSTER